MKLLLAFWTFWYMRRRQRFYWLLRKVQFRYCYPLARWLRPKLRWVLRWIWLARLVGPWPRKRQPPDKPLSADRLRRFRRIFQKCFCHRNAALDSEAIEQLAALEANCFTFLNQPVQFAQVDWNARYCNPLWTFHFHYFDYVVPAAKAFVQGWQGPMRRCEKLIDWWIKQTDVGRGVGWDAYPISLRVVNWMYAYALLADSYDDQEFMRRWRQSIREQLEFLSRHLELHLLTNHLLKNIKALVIGALFFDQPKEIKKWARRLWRELEDQVAEDGGHCERAPMYHAQVLADFLECYALLSHFKHFPPAGEIKRRLAQMAHFLEQMTYADGTFALFNDSACTEETRPEPLLESARVICGYKREGHGVIRANQFPQTGYYVWAAAEKREKIVIDAGPPSVEYNGGHAHCDLLSYELWLGNKMFVVDAGVHGYDGDPYREYCRATRAHNTVLFNGVEQSRVWSTFRLARRARLIGARFHGTEGREEFSFQGEFRRYDRKLTHRRHITRRRAEQGSGYEWMIEDLATSGTMHTGESFIHLHPSWRARLVAEHQVECYDGKQTVLIEVFAEELEPDNVKDFEIAIVRGQANPVQGWYFPDFGEAMPSDTICITFFVKRGDRFGYRIRPRTGTTGPLR